MSSFRNAGARKGTIKLKTLRRPGVRDLSGMFDKATNISDEQLGLADEAGLEGLLAMLDHQHPKIRALAEEMIANLGDEDGEIVVVEGGFTPCQELLRYKNHQAQRDTLWTLAMLAGISDFNHEGIITDVGWPTILSRAKSQLNEIQLPAVTIIANLSLNEEYHDMIIEEDGLALLKSLASTEDIKLKRAVCNAFANLCVDEDNVEIVLEDGGLDMIISFLDSGDDELIAGALHTLANVASNEDVQQDIVDRGGIEPIIKLLGSMNVMIQKGAATAVANLVENQENHRPMMDGGLLEPLLFLARKSKNPEVQFRAASALNNLASNPEMKQVLKDGGAVNPLKSLARSRDPEIKREAIEALAELGITYVSKEQRKRQKAERERQALLLADQQRAEREALEREAMQRQVLKREQLERQKVERESKERMMREALEKERLEKERIERQRLEKEAQERAMREAAEREAQERIQAEREQMKLERMNVDARQKAEREALEKQAREAREALARAQHEKLQLEKERQEREALEREVNQARDSLARARAEREALERELLEAEAAALKLEKAELERSLSEAQNMKPEQPIQLNAPEAIRVVAISETVEVDDERDIDEDYDEEDDEMTEADRREKAKIALVMVDLWEPAEDKSITQSALRKLAALSMKIRNRKLIRIAGAIPILVELLKPSDPSVGLTPTQSLALSVLAVLCRNVRNREDVRRNDGLRHVLRIARVKEEKDLIEDLKALKELAKNDKNKHILREGRLLEFLVSKLLPDNQPIQELALDIITIMTTNDVKSQVTVRDAQGIPPIIKLIYHQEDEIKRRAVRCLGSVAQNNRKIQQMVRKSKGTLKTIVEYLSHENQEVRKAAAGCVASVSENDHSNQIAIRKLGAVAELVNLLSDDESRDDTKEQVAAAIRSLAKGNTKIQADFREGPGIKLLVNLLSVNHLGCKIHATGALMELARDNAKNCDIICYAGAVHPLVDSLEQENKVLQYLTEGCIWALARKSSKRRRLFLDANALEPLRILKMSDNIQVKKGAEWAIQILS